MASEEPRAEPQRPPNRRHWTRRDPAAGGAADVGDDARRETRRISPPRAPPNPAQSELPHTDPRHVREGPCPPRLAPSVGCVLLTLLTRHVAAGGPGSARLLEELRRLEVAPGAFAGAPDDFAGGDGWNTRWAGISPSAWVYLALDGGLLHPSR